MPLPKLTEIGDSATLTVATCTPQETPKGDAVVFTFEECPDDSLMLSRLAVDGAFLRLGFSFEAERSGDDPVIDYAGVRGERLTFSRTKPTRGVVPYWRIEKAAKPATAALPHGKVALLSDEPPAPRQAAPDKDAQRQAVRDRYAAEFAWALNVLVPLARKKKVAISFDVNASVGSLMVDFGKRGLI